MVEEAGQLIGSWSIAGTTTNVGSVLYNATQHAWWRIRESGGTIFWETAPDGKSWTTLVMAAAPAFSLDALDVSLVGGTWEVETSPGAVAYSSFNLPPP
jgi:hypothetical protein